MGLVARAFRQALGGQARRAAHRWDRPMLAGLSPVPVVALGDVLPWDWDSGTVTYTGAITSGSAWRDIEPLHIEPLDVGDIYGSDYL